MHKIYRKTFEEIEVSEDRSWINITNPCDCDVRLICKHTGLEEKEVLQWLLDEYERPSIEKRKDLIIIVFHMPVVSNEKFETMPILIFITPSILITVCGIESQIINDFIVQNACRDFNTAMKSRFVLLLLGKINLNFDRCLRNINGILSDFEHKMMSNTDNREVGKIFHIRKALIYFHTSILGNGKVLQKITLGLMIPIYEEDQGLLENIIIDNEQTLEIVAIYNNIITSSLDAYASVVANNMNVVIKFLTVVTIVISIPTLAGSMWGMNVPVPMQTNPFAFFIVVGLSVLIAGVVGWRHIRR